jgi:2,3-bisphosphoglycerate-independent phosphoglycerate mutase
MKTLFIVLDGLGDDKIPVFKNKTPLGKAKTPNLDRWAKEGKLGLLLPVYKGALPTSEEGHFSLFGYDTEEYGLARGIVTASGAGIDLKEGDVAFRGNFATVFDGDLVDRRAGRVEDPSNLIKEIDGIRIDGIKFVVRSAREHRIGIALKGEGLSSKISDGDPHYGDGQEGLKKITPLDDSEEARFTAEVMNKFLEKTHKILKKHPFNAGRKLPANYILTRGASGVVNLPDFNERYNKKAACIAGKVLYKQIGKLLGMDLLEVEGANGLPDTNLEGKFKTAREAILSDYDFVFVHIKATDSLAEDGKYWEKKEFIERVDKNLAVFNEFTEEIVVTSDHSTCCLQKSHCDNNIPFLIRGRGKDKTEYFSEDQCAKGSLGKIDQRKFLEKIVFSE